MAKMFYSLDEAAAKLKKSANEVREMAKRGEITEFRDGDRLIFKVDQIDLLAGDDEADMSSMIPLADSGAAGAINLSDSGVGGGDVRQKSGISVFDEEELAAADPSAQTQVSGGLDAVTLESFGSGSGLMDLARATDDTSLGTEGLLDELYAGGGEEGAAGGTAAEGALFEGAAAGGDLGGDPAAMMVVAPEAYDPKGSGLTGGLCIGAVAALALGLAVMLMDLVGGSAEPITGLFGGNVLVWLGILAGITLLSGGAGFAMAGRSK